jgi:hypothetical protein
MRRVFLHLARSVLYALLGLVMVLLLVAGKAQIEQRVFRHRAERLLNDMLSIQLRHTTFEQLSPLLGRWREFVTYDIPCSKRHCDLRVEFRQPSHMRDSDSKFFAIFRDFYQLLGGRASGVFAEINVRNGFVWGESYGIGVEVPPFADTDGYKASELTGEISTVPRAEPWRLVWPNLRRPPEYEIGGRTAFKGRADVWVRFTPYADPADIRRLSQFNFSCLARLRPCRTGEDIMPAAMAEISKEKHHNWSGSEEPVCDLPAIRVISRDAENAAVVDVVDNRRDPRYNSDPNRVLGVRLVERVKRASSWTPGAKVYIDVGDPLALAPIDGLAKVRAGDRLIILFGWQSASSIVPKAEAEMCGVVPYTENNLAVVRAGASEDDRVPPLVEYDPQFHPRRLSDPPEPPPPPDRP